MAKSIKCSLSVKSIEKAIKELNKYKKEINQKTELLVSRLGDEGFHTVVAKISKFDAYYTGDLINSVKLDKSKLYAVISVQDESVAFVEFGSGPRGNRSPAEHRPVNWEYDVGPYIRDYNFEGKVIRGWWYFDEHQGKYRFTTGMKPRPFMFNSAQELRLEKLIRIAKEVFAHD